MHWVTLPNRLFSWLSFQLTFTDKLKLVKMGLRTPLWSPLLSRNLCSNNFSGSERPMQYVGPEIGLNVTSDMWTCVILNELRMILIQFVQYIDFTLLTWAMLHDVFVVIFTTLWIVTDSTWFLHLGIKN